MLPLFSHSIPSTTSCTCGLLRSRYQDGIRCENNSLLETPVWKEIGKEPSLRERAGKYSTVMQVWPPVNGRKKCQENVEAAQAGSHLRKVWQNYQQEGNYVSQEYICLGIPLASDHVVGTVGGVVLMKSSDGLQSPRPRVLSQWPSLCWEVCEIHSLGGHSDCFS